MINDFEDKAQNPSCYSKWFQTSLQMELSPGSAIPPLWTLLPVQSVLFHASVHLQMLFYFQVHLLPFMHCHLPYYPVLLLQESGKVSPGPFGSLLLPFKLQKHFCMCLYFVMVASRAFIPLFFWQHPTGCALGICPSSLSGCWGWIDSIHNQNVGLLLTYVGVSHFLGSSGWFKCDLSLSIQSEPRTLLWLWRTDTASLLSSVVWKFL